MRVESNTLIGCELAGRYRVSGKLSEGGMGDVYRAWDAHLDSDVIVKFPRRSMFDDPEFAKRFALEIRSLVRLSHPHIVKLTDVGEHDGVPFAVMQYLGGGSLRDRQQSASDGTPVPGEPEELLRWLEGIALALDFIHSEGFIHRDVKPANILFDTRGNAYLSDFGIAKVLSARATSTERSAVTRTGFVIGTPAYMAPELIMSEPYDGRSDQYSLAVTLHELLSGRCPFDASTPAAVLVHQSTKAPPILHELRPSIPKPLSVAVLKALSKNPRDRFSSCESFAAAVLHSIRGVASMPYAMKRLSDSPDCAGWDSSAASLETQAEIRTPKPDTDSSLPTGRQSKPNRVERGSGGRASSESSGRRGRWYTSPVRLTLVFYLLMMLGSAAYFTWKSESEPTPHRYDPNNSPAAENDPT